MIAVAQRHFARVAMILDEGDSLKKLDPITRDYNVDIDLHGVS